MSQFHAFYLWLAAHPAQVIAALYVIVNVVNGLLPATVTHGPLGRFLHVLLDRLAVLARSDAAGTLKWPMVGSVLILGPQPPASGGGPASPSTGVRAGMLLTLTVLVMALGCSAPQPVPSDGAVVTPHAWTDTARTVVTVLSWALPAADAIVSGIVPPPADVAVHVAFRIAEGSLTALQRALATYATTATAGARCDARAAIDGATVALVGVADALRTTGYGLAPEITSALEALGAIGDELAPACLVDGGALPPSRGAAVRAAASPGMPLRPFPPLPRPVSP